MDGRDDRAYSSLGKRINGPPAYAQAQVVQAA
jgi:hypothetical protein